MNAGNAEFNAIFCFGCDIIIAEQVFEHLLWPYRAVRNVFQMLTPNGALLVTTHF
jgi:hypothetical protein